MRATTLAVIIASLVTYASVTGVPPSEGIHAVAIGIPAHPAEPDDDEDENRVRAVRRAVTKSS